MRPPPSDSKIVESQIFYSEKRECSFGTTGPLTGGCDVSGEILGGQTGGGLLQPHHTMGFRSGGKHTVSSPHISQSSNFRQMSQSTSHRPLSVKNSSEWKIEFHFLCCPSPGGNNHWVSEGEEGSRVIR